MHDEICRKLDRIDELFPRERLEASKHRIRALKNNRKPDRLPFILSNLGFNYYDDVMPAAWNTASAKSCSGPMMTQRTCHILKSRQEALHRTGWRCRNTY